MVSMRDGDHALGLELQIEELVEQGQRARVQHRDDDATALDAEVSQLQSELAETVERAAAHPDDAPIIHAETAEHTRPPE